MNNYIYTLGIFNVRENMFGWATDIYGTTGKIYDLLGNLVNQVANRSFYSSLYNIATIIYVLAGIFMLFRVTVSFLNMLIDPDKISDKSAGAKNIIVRVLLAIIMLIIFEPGSFVFNFLGKVEDALLNSDNGLLANITAQISETDTLKLSLLDEVEAVKEVSYDCYYYHRTMKGTNVINNGTSKVPAYDYDYVVGLHITNNNNGTEIKRRNDVGLYLKNSSTGWHITVKNGSVTDKNNASWNLNSSINTNTFVANDAVIDKYFSEGRCPASMNTNENKDRINFYAGNSYKYDYKNTSLDLISTSIAKETADLESQYGENTSYQNSYSVGNANIIGDIKETNNFNGLSASAQDFSRTLFRCFIDKKETADDTTEESLNRLLTSDTANDEVYQLAKKSSPEISIDYFLSLIVGIVVMVYLLLLCIDVIVRGFKLVILEVMAPLPIISFIDPKDKIFEKWIKMYLTVYADLFIKLLCISLCMALLNSAFNIFSSDMSGFVKLLYIIAILVFAKALPGLVEKIFGFDLSKSSFKEIGKMAKTVLSVGAGAAIGIGAGIGTGAMAMAAAKGQGFGNMALAGAGALKNTVVGGVKGAAGGTKGKITGGISAAQANLKNRNAYSDGLTAKDLAGGALFGGIGLDYASMMDRRMAVEADTQKKLTEFADYKSKVDDIAESSNYMKSLRSAYANGKLKFESGTDIEKEFKNERKRWIAHQLTGSGTFESKIGTKDKDGNYNYVVKGDIEEGKKNGLITTFGKAQGTYEGNTDIQNAYREKLIDIESGGKGREALNKSQLDAIDKRVSHGVGKSYADLSDAEAGAKNAAGKIEVEHTTVKGTAKYRSAAAARELGKNKK